MLLRRAWHIGRWKQHGGDLSRRIQHGDTEKDTDDDKGERLEPSWSLNIEIVFFVHQANIGQGALHRLWPGFVVKSERIKRSGHEAQCNVTLPKPAPRFPPVCLLNCANGSFFADGFWG